MPTLIALGAPLYGQDDSHFERPRVRDLGVTIGVLSPGDQNAITDVAGVKVGHTTLIEGDAVRTGVTAIVPHGENIFLNKVPAAIVVGNGFGKLVGSTQVGELGTLETPILLTNTLSTFAVADALVAWSLEQSGNESVRSINPVVAECNDGYLNDIRGQHVSAEHVRHALNEAASGPVAEGSIGAGTGMRCLGWKGGIGTSSRQLPARLGGHTLGVLTLTNFGGSLTIDGAPVGEALGRYYLRGAERDEARDEKGSIIIVVATDAALDARQLKRLARRALFGLAATGSPMTHGSGDYVIAFSTHPDVRQPARVESPSSTNTTLRDEALSPLFQAVREATEEAIINSILKATTVTGDQGHQVEAIDIDAVVEVLKKHAVIE